MISHDQKCILFLLSIIFGHIFHFQASAQEIRRLDFNHLTHEDGLSLSNVNAITQDNEGFMWFGTSDGLNRYDGSEMIVYRPDPSDSTTIGDSYITNLYEDSHQNLWVGTLGQGLYRYDRDKDHFIQLKADPDKLGITAPTITAIAEDKEGTLWVGTSFGLNRYMPKENTFVHFFGDEHFAGSKNINAISDNDVSAIEVDSKGQVWVGTYNGLNRWDPEKRKFEKITMDPSKPYSLSGNHILDIYEDSNGRIWIGTKRGGLNYYDAAKDRFYHFKQNPNDPYSISENSVFNIFEDSQGTLWVGCETKGLDIFDPQKERFYHYNHRPGDPTSLTNNSIHSIYESRDHTLWVGTFAGGVNYADLKYPMFEHYKHDAASAAPLSHNTIASFLEGEENNFWIGTDGGGLNLLDRQTNTFQTLKHQPGNPNSLSSDVVLDLSKGKNGAIWIGYYNGGISRFNPQKNEFKHYSHVPGDTTSLSSDDVFILHKDQHNNLWVGTNGGDLNLFQPESGTFKRYSTWQDIRAIHDEKDHVWVGTYGGGLIRLNPQNGKTKAYNTTTSGIQSNVVMIIHESSPEEYWLGTNKGLIKFDRKSQDFVQYTVEDGLPNRNINGILEDEKGRLWLSTNNGISRFTPETEEFKNFGTDNGLQGTEFNPLSYYKDSQGFMYFGGINGYNRFHPDSIKISEKVAPVKITGFQIFNDPVLVGPDSPLKKQITQANHIELPYTASVLTFQYTTLNFDKSKENSFAYKMEGFDTQWNYVESKKTATYTNLDPGEYTFKVRAANKDGIWGNNEASIAITIIPPFWQTIWFYLITAVFVGSVIYGGYQYRLRKIRAHNIQLEREVLARTKELNTKNASLKNALDELQNTRDELLQKARKAGMADLATGILHNVGNILNSIKSSTALMEETLQNSKLAGYKKANKLLKEHSHDLNTFLFEDKKGRKLLEYYLKLEEPLDQEQQQLKTQVERLTKKVQLIVEVIDAQQDYAGLGRIQEKVQIEELVEDTLKLQSGSIERHDLRINLDFGDTDKILVQKSKLIHVLINLFKNGREAMSKVSPKDKVLTIRSYEDASHVYLSVSDNGHGISKENLSKIFNHGFTTKKGGHGYGLHTCANYIKEMGGKIEVSSDGVGKGATFTITFTKGTNHSSESGAARVRTYTVTD